MESAAPEPSDEALMQRLQRGEEAVFSTLMARWEIPVKRFLARMVQNQAEAEDLAQDVFVRVYRGRAGFRTGARFAPWLWTIAANQARNRLRWWRRRPVVSLEAWTDGAGAIAADRAGDGAAALLRAERAEAVRAAVASLPVEWRTVVVLCDFEQVSVAEAAEALDCTAKAVESRLYRARNKLRERLAGLTAN